MQLAQRHNFFPLEIEGDSQILINMTQKLLSGSPPSKVAHSWRLMARLELIASWLQDKRAICLKHTKRAGNKVADLLANLGVGSTQTLTEGPLTIIHDSKLYQDCTLLVHQDFNPPDAGD